jgi:hypothetical protein
MPHALVPRAARRRRARRRAAPRPAPSRPLASKRRRLRVTSTVARKARRRENASSEDASPPPVVARGRRSTTTLASTDEEDEEYDVEYAAPTPNHAKKKSEINITGMGSRYVEGEVTWAAIAVQAALAVMALGAVGALLFTAAEQRLAAVSEARSRGERAIGGGVGRERRAGAGG